MPLLKTTLKSSLQGRRWTATVLWLLLLMALTLALGRVSWRYRVVTETLLENLDFQQAGKGWAASGRGIQLYPGTPPVLVLTAAGDGHTVIMSRLLPRSANDLDTLRISADLSSRDLQAGPAPWQRGRLILLSLDARGKRLWYWPQQVAALAGNQSWRRYRTEIPVNREAAQTWLVIYVAAKSGKLLLKNLALNGVTQTGVYLVVRALIIGAWLITGLWILLALAPFVRHSPAALGAVLFALALLAGGLTPQPQLRDGLNSGRQSLADLIAAGAALIPFEKPAPATPGTRRDPPANSPATEKSATEDPGKPASAPKASRRRTSGDSSLNPQLRSAGSSKRTHLLAFAGLSLILLLALRSIPRHRSVLAALLLGAAIESLQSLSITREPEWVDLGYDTAGVLLGTLVALMVMVVLSLAAGRATQPAASTPCKPV